MDPSPKPGPTLEQLRQVAELDPAEAFQVILQYLNSGFGVGVGG